MGPSMSDLILFCSLIGQWRKWMLQLTTFLTHQNGTIHEGLNLWKRNVDKRFQGVEVNNDQNVALTELTDEEVKLFCCS
jgi:hypothetical protein